MRFSSAPIILWISFWAYVVGALLCPPVLAAQTANASTPANDSVTSSPDNDKAQIRQRIYDLQRQAREAVSAHKQTDLDSEDPTKLGLDEFDLGSPEFPVTAGKLYREALDLAQQEFGKRSRESVSALYQLADFYVDFYRREQARPLVQEIVEIDLIKPLTDPSEVMLLAELHKRLQEHEKSLIYAGRSVALCADEFGRENCADIVIVLGEYLIARGQFAEAETLLREARDSFASQLLSIPEADSLGTPGRALFFLTDLYLFDGYPMGLQPNGLFRLANRLPRGFVEQKIHLLDRHYLPLVTTLRLSPSSPKALLDALGDDFQQMSDLEIERLISAISDSLRSQDRWDEARTFPLADANIRNNLVAAASDGQSYRSPRSQTLFVNSRLQEFDKGAVLGRARATLLARGETVPELRSIHQDGDDTLGFSDDERNALRIRREVNQIRDAIQILERANGPNTEPIVAALMLLSRYEEGEKRRVIWADAWRRAAYLEDQELLRQAGKARSEFDIQEEMLAAVVKALKDRFGLDHVDSLLVAIARAELLAKDGKQEAAILQYEEILNAIRPHLEADLDRNFRRAGILALVFGSLNDLYGQSGQQNKQADLVQRFTRLNDSVWLTEFFEVARSAASYFRETQQYDEEASLLSKLVRIRGADKQADDIDTIRMRIALAQAMLNADPQSSGAYDEISLARNLLNSRWGGAILGSDDEDQLARETLTLQGRHALFADAAWAARETGRADPNSIRESAFRALQEGLVGPASQAVVNSAIQRSAADPNGVVGKLLAEREALKIELRVPESDRRNAYLEARQKNDGLNEEEALDLSFSSEFMSNFRSDFDLRSRVRQIDARLPELVPNYFALIYPEPLNLQTAQAILAPDEAFVLVFPGERGTHTIAISQSDIRWHRSDLNAEDARLSVLRLLWDAGARVSNLPPGFEAERDRRSLAGHPYPFDRSTAYLLYRELIQPVSEVLEGKRHVFIAAGGVMASLPFSVLVTQDPTGEDHDAEALRETSWFADVHALTHIPSIQSLQLLRSTDLATVSSQTSFAGFGDPSFEGEAQQRGLKRGRSRMDASSVMSKSRTRAGGVLADVALLRSLSRLPGTAEEIKSMRSLLDAPNSAVFLQEAATETAVRSADLSDVSVLAFATHGMMASDFGDYEGVVEPGLVFTPPDEASEKDDGYLAASEITALNLNAEWVILSACNTATSDGDGTSGLSGLARAFFYAGARNILATHWYVDDTATAQLTVRTIALQRSDLGLSRAEALQQAMREIRENPQADSATVTWAHPTFWSPFVLIGDGAR